jgi:hypothetical protein
MTTTITPALRQSIAFTVDMIRRDRMRGDLLFAYSTAKLLLAYCNRTKCKTMRTLALRVLNECRVAYRQMPLYRPLVA